MLHESVMFTVPVKVCHTAVSSIHTSVASDTAMTRSVQIDEVSPTTHAFAVVSSYQTEMVPSARVNTSYVAHGPFTASARNVPPMSG